MIAVTKKQLIEMLNRCPESKDDTPMYIEICKGESGGGEDYEQYAVIGVSSACGGAHMSITGNDMDTEDQESFL